jgi:hypothetical protein
MAVHLDEPYATALREAVAYIHDRYQPVGIVVSGTIVRGNHGPSSDLDVVVIHEATWRQRVQRFFNGVPIEMFVNPEFQIRRVILGEPANGRPVMSHMIGTGEIIHDPAGVMFDLQALARQTLSAGPNFSPESLLAKRYAIATALEDAADIRAVDIDRAQAMLTDTLIEAAKYVFLANRRWLPRSKTLLADLDTLDPELGSDMRRALGPAGIDERIELTESLAQRIIGATGFFEWESEPQELTP